MGSDPFTVEIWSRGACVNDVRMPDRDGNTASVVLGYDREEDRRAGSAYLGEMCGPFANRIASGGYIIDGEVFTPDLNDNGTATLHGGANGWSRQEWVVDNADSTSVQLHLDWEGPGFPGPIHAVVDYILDGWNLTHTVRASAPQPTVLNVVSHPYFNLSGTNHPIGDHELTVAASSYLPVDEALIPLPDAPWPVDNTSFDFRLPRFIGNALASKNPQILSSSGIDHALIVDGSGWRFAARLHHPGTGRTLEIMTSYPALQVYTGQTLNDDHVAHPAGAGIPYAGIALETEEYPDAPRRPDFPSVLIRPGQTYTRTTTWQFSVQ